MYARTCLLHGLLNCALLGSANHSATTTAPAPAALPGTACTSTSGRGGHTFVALAWDKTCECTDPNFPPQSNGSFCIWWE